MRIANLLYQKEGAESDFMVSGVVISTRMTTTVLEHIKSEKSYTKCCLVDIEPQ